MIARLRGSKHLGGPLATARNGQVAAWLIVMAGYFAGRG
jgi:hypothetical protein